MTLILSVAAGSRSLFGDSSYSYANRIALPPLLAFFYIIVFILMAFCARKLQGSSV